MSNTFYKTNSVAKLKSYPTEFNKTSSSHTKKNNLRHTTGENRSSPKGSTKGKKARGRATKPFNNQNNNEDDEGQEAYEQEEENNYVGSRTLENDCEEINNQMQAKERKYSDKRNFDNEVYQQYDNNVMPQENDNDINKEQEQGREVVVENDEI